MKSGLSLQSQLHELLHPGNSGQDNKTKTIETSSLKIIDNTILLKIINNTVVFGNSVYQIRNICTVELADLTKTYAINQDVPTWYWFLLALGFVLLYFYGIGIFILIFVCWLFLQHNNLEKSRTLERYGLKIGMNSGEGVILTSSSKEFILKIVVTLYEIMNNDETKAVTFNFEDKSMKFEDKSIKIEQAYGSTVVSGQIGRDVVNLIKDV